MHILKMANYSPGRPSSRASTSSMVDGEYDKWERYTQALMDKPSVSSFAIHSKKNYRKWTSTPGFSVTKNEVEFVLSGFSDEQRLRMEGLSLGGHPFTFTRLSLNRVMMFGRCSKTGFGCVVYPCNTCVLIATHEEGAQASLCCNAIEKLGDFLMENGF